MSTKVPRPRDGNSLDRNDDFHPTVCSSTGANDATVHRGTLIDEVAARIPRMEALSGTFHMLVQVHTT